MILIIMNIIKFLQNGPKSKDYDVYISLHYLTRLFQTTHSLPVYSSLLLRKGYQCSSHVMGCKSSLKGCDHRYTAIFALKSVGDKLTYCK